MSIIDNLFESDSEKYIIFDDYVSKSIFYNQLEDNIYSFIGEYIDEKNLLSLKDAGLSNLHQFLDIDLVPEIINKFNKSDKKYIYDAVINFVREELDHVGSFFIDPGIVIRINYPINLAKKSTVKEEDFSLFSNNSFMRMLKKLKRYFMGANIQGSEQRSKYHNSLPFLARAHGPHLDTWYGHSYDGINLWWTISGVEEENGLVFYPDSYGYDFPHEDEPVYLSDSIRLSESKFLVLPIGGMCVLNPEMLHATKVNTSLKTRFAFTIRVVPSQQMSFNWNVTRKNSSWIFVDEDGKSDFIPRRIGNKEVVNNGAKRLPRKAIISSNNRILMPSGVPSHSKIKICAVSDLDELKTYEYYCDDVKYFLVRRGDQIFSLRNQCPHLGIDLSKGYIDPTNMFVTCPGHGLRFDLLTGNSKCGNYSVSKDNTLLEDGFIYRLF